MPSFSAEIELPAPLETAWEVFLKMEDWHRWTDTFRVLELPTGGFVAGQSLTLGPVMAGRQMLARARILECQPPRRLVWLGQELGLNGEHGFEFELIDSERCRLIHFETATGPAVPALRLIGWWSGLQKRVRQFNSDLAGHLGRQQLAPTGEFPKSELQSGSRRLSYVDLGPRDAEPVLLLHGYLGSHRTWRYQLESLSRTHRVLALDWYGWGESQRDSSTARDYRAEIEELRKVLDLLELPRVSLAGHDYGGFLGLGLAQAHPERISRLALINSRSIGTFTPFWYAVFRILGLGARAPRFLRRFPLASFHRQGLAREVARGIITARELDQYVDWIDSEPEAFCRMLADYDLRVQKELSNPLRCPCTVIWGGQDPYLNPHLAHRLKETFGADLTLFPEAGHFLCEERPAEVLSTLQDWLRQ